MAIRSLSGATINLINDEEEVAQIADLILTNKRLIANHVKRDLLVLPGGARTDIAMLQDIDSVSIGKRRLSPVILLIGIFILMAAFLFRNITAGIIGGVFVVAYFAVFTTSLVITVSGKNFIELHLTHSSALESAEHFINSLYVLLDIRK